MNQLPKMYTTLPVLLGTVYGGRCETLMSSAAAREAHGGNLYLDFIQMHADKSENNLSASRHHLQWSMLPLAIEIL